MNNVKLLHIKCCFFQFFNSPVALKNKKKFGPPKKKLKWRPWSGASSHGGMEANASIFGLGGFFLGLGMWKFHSGGFFHDPGGIFPWPRGG